MKDLLVFILCISRCVECIHNSSLPLDHSIWMSAKLVNIIYKTFQCNKCTNLHRRCMPFYGSHQPEKGTSYTHTYRHSNQCVYDDCTTKRQNTGVFAARSEQINNQFIQPLLSHFLRRNYFRVRLDSYPFIQASLLYAIRYCAHTDR
jgi:hypothetical protein